jgi:nucleotide-binding universal stress UspA family protein
MNAQPMNAVETDAAPESASALEAEGMIILPPAPACEVEGSARAAGDAARSQDYATLIVHVQATEDGEARLQCAIDLAGAFGATLIGVGAETVPPSVFADPTGIVVADAVNAMFEYVDRELADARALFEDRTAGLSPKTLWMARAAEPGEAVARLSRCADLIVAGHAKMDGHAHRDVNPGALVIAAGRPVLFTPTSPAPIGRRVLVAWKDTREARRALADAMPFLVRAEAVTVLSLCGEEGENNADTAIADVAAAIRRHGARGEVTTRVVSSSDASGDAVVDQAALVDADLIVAGGYGHSRLGEWVFGGVTRTLLRQDAVAVLMSH